MRIVAAHQIGLGRVLQKVQKDLEQLVGIGQDLGSEGS
jgi:hypothetical protein